MTYSFFTFQSISKALFVTDCTLLLFSFTLRKVSSNFFALFVFQGTSCKKPHAKQRLYAIKMKVCRYNEFVHCAKLNPPACQRIPVYLFASQSRESVCEWSKAILVARSWVYVGVNRRCISTCRNLFVYHVRNGEFVDPNKILLAVKMLQSRWPAWIPGKHSRSHWPFLRIKLECAKERRKMERERRV